MATAWCIMAPLLLLGLSYVMSAPLGESTGISGSSETKSDVPVEQLEKLKSVILLDCGVLFGVCAFGQLQWSSRRILMIRTPAKMVHTRGSMRRERGDASPLPAPEEVRPSASAAPTEPQETRSFTKQNSAKSLKSRKSSLASSETRKKRLELELQAAQEKAKIRMELIDKQLEVNIASLEEENGYSSQEEEEIPVYVNKWLEGLKKEPSHGSASLEPPAAPAQQCAAPAADDQPQTHPVPARTIWHTPLATAPTSPALPPVLQASHPHQLRHALPAPDAPAPPAPVAPMENYASGTDATTIQMLATALKNVTSGNGGNANLLSRICTPRDLPEFSGEPLEWLQFKHAFDESTEVCGFTERENLWRLRKCLRGAAKEAVSALLISATSPAKIIAALELRFGNPDFVITKILQDIKRLPPMSNEYQKEIVIFACKIQNFVEAVRAVGREDYLYGMSIVSIILSKIPSVLLAKWTDYSYPFITENNKSRLIILSDFLSDEARKVSVAANIYTTLGRTDNIRQKAINHSYNNNQTVLVHSGAECETNGKCHYCKISRHKLSECKKFKRALRKVRWEYVKRNGICFKCINARHDRQTCPAPACDKDGCNQPHHKLLHYSYNSERRDNSEITQQPNAVEQLSDRSETVTHINSSDKCEVLLKIVPIRIHGPNGVLNVNALLDDGATVSLISGELARRAGLRGRRRSMRVSGAWTGNDLVCDATVMNVNISAAHEGSEAKSEHVEYHRLDSVKQNGELVSRLEEHASADAVGNEKPQVHASSKLDVPAEGIHRVLVQDGAHVSVHEATVPTTAASEEQTTKVFHGAARLVQPGSLTTNPNGHTAARRAFNADVTKETKNNMDHYPMYSGVQYSPLDMAEYVFWTGDERGVTAAIEDFLQEGMMTKEEAITFLQEIKFNIDYLRAHYSQNLKAAEENAQQEQLRTMLMQQANAKEYQLRNAGLSFPFGNSPDIIRSLANKNWELSNNLSPVPVLPVTSDLRPEPVKRYDPMLQTNTISTSDYDRDGAGAIISEEEYEEMMDKLKAADNLYTEYTLEEIIYQLAKMMFAQSLSRDPAMARAATQRFMAFLELEAERGQLSRTIEKKVLDVMIAALTDTIGDHPELLQNREGNSANRLMRQFLDTSMSEPSASRAILAAYKDELIKGQPLHKFSFPDRI